VELLSAVLAAALGLASAAPQDGEARGETPSYSNEDLERMTPLRHQTGALSEPAFSPASARSSPKRRSSGSRSGGEDYWRREADRLRRRLRPLLEQLQELRLKIEERRSTPGVRPYTDPKTQSLERKAESLSRRIRDWQDRFEERARRKGALPGWLR
jgi:hypothetical protein